MEVAFTDKARTDLAFWKKSGDKTTQRRISKLIEAIVAAPYDGIGKPEPLKYELTGLWWRRIDSEHRLVYEVGSGQIIIHSLKGHY